MIVNSDQWVHFYRVGPKLELQRELAPVNVVLVFFFFTGAAVVVVVVDVETFSCVDSDAGDEDDSCFGLWLEAVFFFSLFLVGAELLKGWSSKIE